MTLLKIAFRNVLKNRRRSLITVTAIAFGFMAVALFKGYTHNSYGKIALGAVFLETPGHLVVFKKGFLEEGKLDPSRFLFSAEDLQAVQGVLARDPEVVWTAPKLALAGLITNGDTSTIFLADAMEPAEEEALWAHWPGREMFPHDSLPLDQPHAAFLAPQLARLLRLGSGDDAVLMATTQHGQMNAVDIQMTGTSQPVSEALDDKYVKLPLGLARDLYDFDGADRVCVLLGDGDATETARARLSAQLAAAGLEVELRTWSELSLYYQKVKGYLDVVFLFIFLIVMVIVVMSTFNTMSMAVYERTREVGTLRAIGLKPAQVLAMFSLEGTLLGAAGSAAGALLALVGFLILHTGRLTYTPPGVASPVAVEVDLVPEVLLLSLAFFVVLAVVSAALPARRAARQNIVDALGHV